MKAWTQVTAVLSEEPQDWSVWVDLFDRHGLPGTIQEENPPRLSAYVAPGDESDVPQLQAALLAHGAVEVQLAQVQEEDWAESWKQFFVPRRIAERWVVRPTWEYDDAAPGDRVIVLDPGQAFGTGDHPTTRGCLTLLEEMDLSGKRVADIGCGSGILAVAAMMLGASSCDAVDVESQSVEAAIENAARNGVEVSVKAGLGFNPLPMGQYDVVLSNIISAALIALAPEVATRVAAGGAWVVSGIIQANWPDVQAAAESQGFRLDREIRELEWVTARFLR